MKLAELKLVDLLRIMEEASKTWLNTKFGAKLNGMERPLSAGEVVALSYFEAVVMRLNAAGAFRDGFVGSEGVPLEYANSEADLSEWGSEAPVKK